MTPTLNSPLSPAELCRANGWSAGTRLVGDEGRGPTVIEITAVGESTMLARAISHNGEPWSEWEWSWNLSDRDWRPATPATIAYATRAERIEAAMHELTRPVPGTKGMGPKDRAQRLHAELERRIGVAKAALEYVVGERA